MIRLKSIRNTLMQLLIKEKHISNKNSMKMPYYNMTKQLKLTLRAFRLLLIKGLYINKKKNKEYKKKKKISQLTPRTRSKQQFPTRHVPVLISL